MEKKQTGSKKALIIALIVIVVLLVFAIIGFFAVRFLFLRNPAAAIVNVTVDIQDETGNSVENVDEILLKVSGEGFKEFEKNIDVDDRQIKLQVPSGEERLFEVAVSIDGEEFNNSEKVDLLPGSENNLNIIINASISTEETAEGMTTEETTAEEGTTTKETTEEHAGTTVAPDVVEIDRIYGPVIEGGFCVQRFRVIFNGSPATSISWNHDDSSHAFGNDVAQVNLDPGEDFNLQVTVTNSAGSDTSTRHVTYECEEPNHPPDITGITAAGFDGGAVSIATSAAVEITVTASDPDGDPLDFDSTVSSGGIGAESNPNPNSYRFTYTAPGTAGVYVIQISVEDGRGGSDTAGKQITVTAPVHEVTFNVVSNETGYVDIAGNVFGTSVYAGNDASNRACRGYNSFDISSIANKHIEGVTLVLSPIINWGDYSNLGTLYLGTVSHGVGPLVGADYGISSSPLTSYPAASVGNISYSSADLTSRLQTLVSASNPRIQFRLHWSIEMPPANGAWDGVGWLPANCRLTVRYTD